jgi:hypothetical protein
VCVCVCVFETAPVEEGGGGGGGGGCFIILQHISHFKNHSKDVVQEKEIGQTNGNYELISGYKKSCEGVQALKLNR